MMARPMHALLLACTLAPSLPALASACVPPLRMPTMLPDYASARVDAILEIDIALVKSIPSKSAVEVVGVIVESWTATIAPGSEIKFFIPLGLPGCAPFAIQPTPGKHLAVVLTKNSDGSFDYVAPTTEIASLEILLQALLDKNISLR